MPRRAFDRYEPMIGLGTRVELGAQTKMCCGSTNDVDTVTNAVVWPVRLGLPGSIPVANRMTTTGGQAHAKSVKRIALERLAPATEGDDRVGYPS